MLVIIFGVDVLTVSVNVPASLILVVNPELAVTVSFTEPRRTIPVFRYAALDTIQESIDSS